MRRSPAVVLLLALAGACSGADARREPEERPPEPLRVATALDTARLAQAYDHAEQLPRLRSLLVQWRDTIVGERYYGGATATRRANTKSASKSVVSALVGIAIAQGHIAGVHQPISKLLPAETRGLPPEKRAITVGDLLSMRTGLESTSFDNYGRWVTSRNWVRSALARPVVAGRGEGGPMLYSTGSTHLLSAILTRATGSSTYAYARAHLARPLGIDLRPWLRDPQGIYFGGNDMYLTPREMLRFGTLYLHRGAWQGQQILPAEWVDSSFVVRGYSRFNGNGYGYGWWTREVDGTPVHYAWGYGGQFIFVVPALQLVVVATSDAETPREGGHNRALHRLVEDEIIRGVALPR